MKAIFLFLSFIIPLQSFAQTNITVSNPEAAQILAGDFNPEDYEASTVISNLTVIDSLLVQEISTDSLFSYLKVMQSFGNRNTGSDTISETFGMGAARRWAYSVFEKISIANEHRLIPAYLEFDQSVCAMGHHKNAFAVLPGSGPKRDEMVLIEAHLDSRCEGPCDVDCMAEGMEDNGSGCALVLELARVLSPFTFDRSIIFMLTTGEEQGLLGANAFSQYAVNTGMKIKGVLNNDVIGGIICGETASPPGCPGLNAIDSINVRIFSAGTIDSKNKQLARYTKLQFNEKLREGMPVKPVIRIMTPEDRTGRGGDHIPFREDGFAAIRFTSANEHGDANSSHDDYHDRQHSVRDILGIDTDNDGELDSFFVDFNYLKRNAIINGSCATSLSYAPESPYDLSIEDIPGGFIVSFSDSIGFDAYRVAIRAFDNNDWDTLITIHHTLDTIFGLPSDQFYAISVLSVDDDGVESLPSNEEWGSFPSGIENQFNAHRSVELIQNRPNPFDEATVIGIYLNKELKYNEAYLVFTGTDGQLLTRIPLKLNVGLNEVTYDYRYHNYRQGTYLYSLVIDGQVFDTKSMVYAY